MNSFKLLELGLLNNYEVASFIVQCFVAIGTIGSVVFSLFFSLFGHIKENRRLRKFDISSISFDFISVDYYLQTNCEMKVKIKYFVDNVKIEGIKLMLKTDNVDNVIFVGQQNKYLMEHVIKGSTAMTLDRVSTLLSRFSFRINEYTDLNYLDELTLIFNLQNIDVCVRTGENVDQANIRVAKEATKVFTPEMMKDFYKNIESVSFFCTDGTHRVINLQDYFRIKRNLLVVDFLIGGVKNDFICFLRKINK